MHTAARVATSSPHASLSAPQLGALRPSDPSASRTNPESRALELVRGTYLDYLISAESEGRFSRGRLFELATQALDQADIDIEETIARLCAQPQGQAATAAQAKLDHDALRAFGEVIEKRKWGEAHIGLHWDGPTDPFRTPEMPSERIITDRHILESLEGVFRQKLLRALTFVLFPGDEKPRDRVFAQAPQLREALTRIPRAHSQWCKELCQSVLGPIAHANRALAEREASLNADTLTQILTLGPDALAEKLDTLDACGEDALSFACARALESKHDEHMGIPIERWRTLSQHLDARTRHLREAKPLLRDIAQALSGHVQKDTAALMCALRMSTPLSAKLQRSIATSMLLGADGQAAIDDAFKRLMRLDTEPSLAQHIEHSTAFSERLSRVFPILDGVLNTLLPMLQTKGLRLDQQARDMGRITEGAIIEAIASSPTQALASVQCQQLLNDCRNTLQAHHDNWRDCAAQSLLQHLRQVGAKLLPDMQSIEREIKSLGIEAPSQLITILTCGALGYAPTAREWGRRAFACLESAPAELKTLRERWLGHDLKLNKPLLIRLAELRQKGPTPHAKLAHIIEPLTNRLREQVLKQAESARKAKAPTKESDEALLAAAIASANSERNKAAQRTPHGTISREASDALEYAIDQFLAKMPRTVSAQKQLDALTRFFHKTSTEDLLELTLTLINRCQYIAYNGSAAPYKSRSETAEKWLAMVLEALRAMDGVSTRRTTVGEVKQCLLEQVLEFDKTSPASVREAEKLANRFVLSSTRLLDMVISMKNTGAKHADVKENALRAALEACQQYQVYSDILAKTPRIGPLLHETWQGLLDGNLGHFDEAAPMSESIFAEAWLQKSNEDADVAMKTLLGTHREQIDEALDDQEALTHIKRLIATSGLDLRTGYMASPGLAAIHHLTIKLLAMTGYPRQ